MSTTKTADNRSNVLYITYDGALGALGQSQVINYLKGLCKNDLHFFLLSFEKKKNVQNPSLVAGIARELAENDIRWTPLTYHEFPKVLSTLFDICVGIFTGICIVASKKIKIIHARAEVPAVIALVISKLFGVQFIYDRRGMLAHEYVDGGMWKKESPLTKILFPLVNSLDRQFIVQADSIVVLTERIAAILRNDFSGSKHALDITTIPCCVDLNVFTPVQVSAVASIEEHHTFTLVYTGSLGTWYMLEEMADFFKTLIKDIPKAHFLILTMTDHSFAKKIMDQKNVPIDSYTITGIPHKEVPETLRTCQASLMFIKPVFSKIASSPTKFAENLACGLPVVMNRGIGDTERIIVDEKVGVIIDAFTTEAYAQATAELRLLLHEGERLRQRCRATAEKYFSLEYGVSRYNSIYQKLLKRT